MHHFCTKIGKLSYLCKLSLLIVFAVGTIFGSAVRMPSTSVYILTSLASRNLPKSVAVKSLPPLPKVVIDPSSPLPM